MHSRASGASVREVCRGEKLETEDRIGSCQKQREATWMQMHSKSTERETSIRPNRQQNERHDQLQSSLARSRPAPCS
jgi:hypothetical protein